MLLVRQHGISSNISRCATCRNKWLMLIWKVSPGQESTKGALTSSAMSSSKCWVSASFRKFGWYGATCRCKSRTQHKVVGHFLAAQSRRSTLTVPVHHLEPRMRFDLCSTIVPQSRPRGRFTGQGDQSSVPLAQHDRVRAIDAGGCHTTQAVFRLAEEFCQEVGAVAGYLWFRREAERFSPVQAVDIR